MCLSPLDNHGHRILENCHRLLQFVIMIRLLALLCTAGLTHAFTAPRGSLVARRGGTQPTRNTQLAATPDDDEPELFGGYTAKQRMREEIESPFRKVRLIFLSEHRLGPLSALFQHPERGQGGYWFF